MSSRKSGADSVYKTAEAWVDCALRSDDSLFTPGKAIWSRELLGELRERFLDRYDDWKGPDFFDKVGRLLDDSPSEVRQLMAEAIFTTYLIVWKGAAGRAAKLKRINKVLGRSNEDVSISDDLSAGLDPGIAHPGAFFIANFGIHPGYVIEFVENWKEMESTEIDRPFSDPWEFKRFVLEVPFRSEVLKTYSPIAQQQALLHLVHPDTFEGMVSVDQKNQIGEAKAFAHFVTEPTDDVDRKLFQIRRGLETGLGRDFDFHDRDILSWWNPQASDLWDTYLRFASEFLDSGRLESWELNYKYDIGQKLAAAREAVLSSADDWIELVKSGFSSNLTPWQQSDDFNKWCVGNPVEALRALQSIWADDNSSMAERINHFSALLPTLVTSGAGTRMRLISVLLMGLDVEKHPPLMKTTFRRCLQTHRIRPTREGYG